jgi:hypothetical protein
MGKKNNAYNNNNNNKLMTNNLEHMTIVSVNCQTEYYNLQLTWKDRHSNDTSKTQTKKREKDTFPLYMMKCLNMFSSAKLYISIKIT